MIRAPAYFVITPEKLMANSQLSFSVVDNNGKYLLFLSDSTPVLVLLYNDNVNKSILR